MVSDDHHFDHSLIVLNMVFIDRGLTWMLPCMCCTSLPSSLSHLAFSNSANCLISFEFVLFTWDNFLCSCSSSSAVKILYPHLTRPPGRGLTADPLEDELDILSFRPPRLPDLQQARLPLQRTFHLQKNIFVKSAKEQRWNCAKSAKTQQCGGSKYAKLAYFRHPLPYLQYYLTGITIFITIFIIVSIFPTFLQRSTMTNLSSCSSLIPLSLPSAANSAFIIIDYETSSNTGLKYLKKIYIVFQSNGVKKVNVKKITLTTSPQVVSSTIPLIHFSLLFTRKGTWPGLKNNNDRKRHRWTPQVGSIFEKMVSK